MRIVCDLLIGLGKALTVEFTSADTLTTLLSIDNYPSLRSSYICINRIRGKVNLSSKGIKFKHCGFTGNPIFGLWIRLVASH